MSEATSGRSRPSWMKATIRGRERLMHERYRMLLQLVDNSPNVMFIKDAEGRYVFLNRHYARALGRHVIEFLGRDEHEFGATPPGVADRDRGEGTGGVRERPGHAGTRRSWTTAARISISSRSSSRFATSAAS